MSLLLISVIILIGLLFLILELLVVPGGILGLVGLLFIAWAIYEVYDGYGSTYGHISLGITLISGGILVYKTLTGKFWDRLTLKQQLNGGVKSDLEGKFKIGDQGKTLSVLRPMGNAFINNESIEVSSYGEPIAAHENIEIVKIEDHKIFVKKL